MNNDKKQSRWSVTEAKQNDSSRRPILLYTISLIAKKNIPPYLIINWFHKISYLLFDAF